MIQEHGMGRKSMRKAIFGAVLAVGFAALAPLAHAGEGAFVATKSDSTIRTLVARWALLENRPLAWDAKFDVRIRDPEGLNRAAGLQLSEGLEDAVGRLLHAMSAELTHARGESEGVPLRACIYAQSKTIAIVERHFPCI